MKDLIPVKFNEEVVITTKMLASVYECEEKQIIQNFNNNKSKFVKGVHYYKLEGVELKEFKRVIENFDEPLYQEIKFVSVLILWTKRGASRHCKMLGTDKAWEMFDKLEENYFNPKPQLTKHDQAILNIINSRTDIEQAIAIKDFEKVVTGSASQSATFLILSLSSVTISNFFVVDLISSFLGSAFSPST